MSALMGERDTLIMNTVPRYAAPLDRVLMLTASATVFEVSPAGVPTPASITFSALMLGAVGEISFSSEPPLPLPLAVANGDAVLKYADMSSSIVTVTASTVIEGVTYRARQTVATQQALDLAPPPAPTGLVATGTPSTIVLRWNAAPANYNNLSHTEVWRAPVNNFAQAVLAGRADGREYTDAVGPGAFRYYWIRYVSRAAIPGPYNAGSGTVGASDAEVEHLLGVLTGEITQSQLYADLGAKIDLIVPTRDALTDLEQVYGDTASAAASAAAAALDAAAADAAAGGASQYASHASQSATNASTAAGAASTSAGQSSQAATAANGSAAAAASSASTAANAAGAAGASASAASTSKDAAAGSADAAGVQAAASSQSAIEAKAARDAASGSASAALQSAGSASASSTAAGGAASQAASSAQLAAASNTAAGGAAAAAAGSATTAGTKSTQAAQLAEAARADRIAAEAAYGQAAGAAQAASGSAQAADARATAAGQSATAASNAAATAGTAAGEAGSYLNQVAQSATQADGSAQAAASYLLQAQAKLNDPITGLVTGVAAVKAAGEATANSVEGLKAKYSIKLDVGNVVGGLELLGGGGAINFAVRASAFSIAAPAGSGIPTTVPFIVRTTESVVDGVTIPIGTYIANAFIQNASITNAKIGGDIWSSNWSPNVSGWYLERSGNFYANNVRLRGNIAGGAFTSYAWPANGTGFYLGPEGLLLGNPASGAYVELGSNGSVGMPGFTVINGQATFSGRLAAASGTFAGNVVTGSGTGFRVEMGPDDPVYAMWAGSGAKTDVNAIFYLKRNGAAYFGGALSAGILRTSVTNPAYGPNQQVVTGPFGSNGGVITVVGSIALYSQEVSNRYTFSHGAGTTGCSFTLYRTLAGGAEAAVHTFYLPGTEDFRNFYSYDPEGIGSESYATCSINGSFTFTDPLQSTLARTYRLAAAVTLQEFTRTRKSGAPSGNDSKGGYDQRTTIVTTE